MMVNLALPGRALAYYEGGKSQFGTLKAIVLLVIFPGVEAVQSVSEEVKQQTIEMIEEAM